MEYGPTARLTIIALTLISHTMGCASQGGDGHWTHMLMRDQPYYLSGPQQGRQPDGNFVAGTRARFIEDGENYARMETEDGVTAWTSKSALKPQTMETRGWIYDE